jgi:LysM repeat protein
VGSQKTATKPRKRRHVAAIALAPVAIAALTSVIFGLSAQADKADSATPKHLKPKDDLASGNQAAKASAPVARPNKYLIVEGDTLRDVASRFGVSTAELLAANGLSWRTMIVVGQELKVPRDSVGSASREIQTVIRSHRVSSGETLEAIARLNQVQPRAIMSANGLHSTSRLIVGQRLVIPNAEVMEALTAIDAAGVATA